jgi:hypothetical protein
MEQILTFIQSQDVFAWVGALVALLSAVIAVASLIPGDEPENTLQNIPMEELITRKPEHHCNY